MPRAFIGHTAAINSVDLSPDEKRASPVATTGASASDIRKRKFAIGTDMKKRSCSCVLRRRASVPLREPRMEQFAYGMWKPDNGSSGSVRSVVAALSSASISPEGDCLVLGLADGTARSMYAAKNRDCPVGGTSWGH